MCRLVLEISLLREEAPDGWLEGGCGAGIAMCQKSCKGVKPSRGALSQRANRESKPFKLLKEHETRKRASSENSGFSSSMHCRERGAQGKALARAQTKLGEVTPTIALKPRPVAAASAANSLVLQGKSLRAADEAESAVRQVDPESQALSVVVARDAADVKRGVRRHFNAFRLLPDHPSVMSLVAESGTQCLLLLKRNTGKPSRSRHAEIITTIT